MIKGSFLREKQAATITLQMKKTHFWPVEVSRRKKANWLVISVEKPQMHLHYKIMKRRISSPPQKAILLTIKKINTQPPKKLAMMPNKSKLKSKTILKVKNVPISSALSIASNSATRVRKKRRRQATNRHYLEMLLKILRPLKMIMNSQSTNQRNSDNLNRRKRRRTDWLERILQHLFQTSKIKVTRQLPTRINQKVSSLPLKALTFNLLSHFKMV